MPGKLAHLINFSKLLFVLLFINIFLAACFFFDSSQPPVAREPNQGGSIRVWLDGKRTTEINQQRVEGLRFFSPSMTSLFWEVSGNVSGSPKIEYKADNSKLGAIKEAKLSIERMPDHREQEIMPYYSNLSSPSTEFKPGYTIQIDNFQSAESAAVLTALPKGNYIFSLYVYGEKDWDKQDIVAIVD